MSSKLGPTAISEKKSETKLNEILAKEEGVSLTEFDEVDFDYDSVNSPGAWSTSSEPVYIRQPGFDYHAHEFKATSNTTTGKNYNNFEKTQGVITSPNPIPQNSNRICSSFPLKAENTYASPPLYTPPSNSPVLLFSPVQRLAPESPPSRTLAQIKPSPSVSHVKPGTLSPTLAKAAEGSQEKSRTGNHTPPGETSSKGVKKKKPNAGDQSRSGNTEVSRSSGKSKIKREPLPMKMRALPQSFWLQPNKNNNVPPSCSVLPPLIIGKDVSDVIEVCPTSTISVEKDQLKADREDRPTERMIKVGNPELLLRLFDSVEKDDKKKAQVVRKGRPRKSPSVLQLRPRRDEDPCLVSTATDSIFPLLQERTPASSGSSTPLGIRQVQGQQVMELINLKEGDRTISLPSLNTDHGYSQLLSELVLRL